jgi:DNA-binding response OmpR family regulator
VAKLSIKSVVADALRNSVHQDNDWLPFDAIAVNMIKYLAKRGFKVVPKKAQEIALWSNW